MIYENFDTFFPQQIQLLNFHGYLTLSMGQYEKETVAEYTTVMNVMCEIMSNI